MKLASGLNGPHKGLLWGHSGGTRTGHLTSTSTAQGIHKIKGTNTIYFIDKSEIPKEKLKQVTHARIVVDYKPHKVEKNRTRVKVDGDRIHCDYDISAPTCSLPTIKLLWNSVLSTPGAKYFTMDTSNFYLGSPLEKPEYI